MPYYPSSQVKTNLYTNGSELTLNGSPYIGFYFKNSKGEHYSGKTPQSPTVSFLEVLQGVNDESPIKVAELEYSIPEPNAISAFYVIDYPYYASTGKNFNVVSKGTLPPIQELNIPTEGDYTIGEFTRYFLKKTNEIQFIEVNKKQQDLFVSRNSTVQWELFTPISITWILEGDIKTVFNTNKNIVQLSETVNNCYGFVNYFNNRFTKFYKPGLNEDIKDTDIKRKINTSTKISGGY